jgi:hypothetical protein
VIIYPICHKTVHCSTDCIWSKEYLYTLNSSVLRKYDTNVCYLIFLFTYDCIQWSPLIIGRWMRIPLNVFYLDRCRVVHIAKSIHISKIYKKLLPYNSITLFQHYTFISIDPLNHPKKSLSKKCRCWNLVI